MNPLVSINCITYNHEEYIADAIEGFLMQKTNFEYEILIGEDCSTDRTREIIQKYIEKYPEKIKLITSEKNVGGNENVLRVFKQSRGKYIADCEGDDYWTDPFKLQKQVDYMEANPQCSLHTHAAEIVKANKKPTMKFIRPVNKDKVYTTGEILKNHGGFLATASWLYRKEVLNEIPEFYLKAEVLDYPFRMICAEKGYVFYKNEVMSAYRTGVRGSWTQRNLAGKDLRKKIIRNHESDISILKGFDEYSNYKYSKIINGQIEFRKAQISLLQKKFSVLNTYFKDESLIRKMKLVTEGLFPEFYRLLTKWKWFVTKNLYLKIFKRSESVYEK